MGLQYSSVVIEYASTIHKPLLINNYRNDLYPVHAVVIILIIKVLLYILVIIITN